MNYRNTRQKSIILEVIHDSRNHPTIAEICKTVQEIDSSIGQATIYRNVKKLLENGKISQLKTKRGIDRYDYYQNHIHLECLKCGKVFDIIDDKLLKSLLYQLSKKGNMKDYHLMLEGYCDTCSKGQ